MIKLIIIPQNRREKIKFVKFLLFSCLVVLSSCFSNNGEDRIYDLGKSYLGKTLAVSKSVQESFVNPTLRAKYIVVVYLDSTSCTPCSIKNLKQYELHDFKKFDVKIIVVINNQDSIHINRNIKDYGINCPVIFDIYGEIKKNNPFLKENLFQTFVIDANRRIIWLGSPIETSQTWKLFKKMISN